VTRRLRQQRESKDHIGSLNSRQEGHVTSQNRPIEGSVFSHASPGSIAVPSQFSAKLGNPISASGKRWRPPLAFNPALRRPCPLIADLGELIVSSGVAYPCSQLSCSAPVACCALLCPPPRHRSDRARRFCPYYSSPPPAESLCLHWILRVAGTRHSITTLPKASRNGDHVRHIRQDTLVRYSWSSVASTPPFAQELIMDTTDQSHRSSSRSLPVTRP